MEIVEYIVYGIGVFVTVGWLIAIRSNVAKGDGVPTAIAVMCLFFSSSLILVALLPVTPFHLLWLFPVAIFLGVLAINRYSFMGSILFNAGRLFGGLVLIGMDRDRISKRRGLIFELEKSYRNILCREDESMTISAVEYAVHRHATKTWLKYDIIQLVTALQLHRAVDRIMTEEGADAETAFSAALLHSKLLGNKAGQIMAEEGVDAENAFKAAELEFGYPFSDK